MTRLPEEQRTAIVLKEYHGLTFQEIADLMSNAVAITLAGRSPQYRPKLTRLHTEISPSCLHSAAPVPFS